MSDVSSTSSTTYTGMSGAGGGDLIRLTGMATGLDVDGTVKKMMAAEQTKLDKVKQQQQLIQWKQEAYQAIIKDVKDLQSSFFDSSSSDKNILSSTNFAAYSVSGDNTTTVDTSVAAIKPQVGAKTGKYTVNVAKLASGAGISNTLTGMQLSTKLAGIGLTGNIQLIINANGSSSNTTITLDNSSGDKTLGDLINAINNQGVGNVKAAFSELTGEFDLNTTKTGDSTSLAIESGTTSSFTSIFGNNFIGQTINSDIDTNTYTKAHMGTNADVTIKPPGTTTGTDVKTQASNNFTIDNVSYNLSSTGEITVNVGQDTDKVYDKIKSFIDKYNSVVDEIETKLDEKKDNDYNPLTDSQKESMSDSQVTAWETKAKVGVLRNDDDLRSMLNNLRSSFTTAVSNAGLSIGTYGDNSIGIDTSSDYDKPGHIEITDEGKLKDAITNRGDQIVKLFTNVSSSSDKTTAYNENGIFTRIKNILQDNVGYTNTTLNSAILTAYANKQDDYSIYGTSSNNTLPDQLYQKQLQIKQMTAAMSDKQEQYYQQFSALETAMESLNNQQSMLSSMLGS
jgi:flagellar hook-associated protein 2